MLLIFQSPVLEGIRGNPYAWTTDGGDRGEGHRQREQGQGAWRCEGGKLSRTDGRSHLSRGRPGPVTPQLLPKTEDLGKFLRTQLQLRRVEGTRI